MNKILKLIILLLFTVSAVFATAYIISPGGTKRITERIIIYAIYKSKVMWLLHVNTDSFAHLTEYQSEKIKGSYGSQILVHKTFVHYLDRINAYAVSNNVDVRVNQGFRSNKKKIYLPVVKPATRSNHLAGNAIDFNLIYKGRRYFKNNLERKNLKNQPKDVQNFINDIIKDKELRWGGLFGDPIHIDYPLNKKNKTKWNKYKHDCIEDYDKSNPRWKFWN